MIIVPNLVLLIVLIIAWCACISCHAREGGERLAYNILGGFLIGFGMKLAGLQVFM